MEGVATAAATTTTTAGHEGEGGTRSGEAGGEPCRGGSSGRDKTWTDLTWSPTAVGG